MTSAERLGSSARETAEPGTIPAYWVDTLSGGLTSQRRKRQCDPTYAEILIGEP